MPGKPGRPHPTPVDTTPINTFSLEINGPPESAWRSKNKILIWQQKSIEVDDLQLI